MKITDVIGEVNEAVIKMVWDIERRSINKYEAGERMMGFKIMTYESGSLHLKTTYANTSSLPFVNLNPIILDSEGKANIHGVGKYRIDVLDREEMTFIIFDDVDGDMNY